MRLSLSQRSRLCKVFVLSKQNYISKNLSVVVRFYAIFYIKPQLFCG
jgi:DNA phosphorothioation-dependent restriction protein DptG